MSLLCEYIEISVVKINIEATITIATSGAHQVNEKGINIFPKWMMNVLRPASIPIDNGTINAEATSVGSK